VSAGRALALAALVVACGPAARAPVAATAPVAQVAAPSAGPAGPTDDHAAACRRIVPAAMTRVVAMQAAPSGDPRADAELATSLRDLGARMTTVMTARCVADGWSTDALACLDAARADADFAACDLRFTAVQKDAVDREMASALAAPPRP
jgi:hypothetical protein